MDASGRFSYVYHFAYFVAINTTVAVYPYEALEYRGEYTIEDFPKPQ